MNAYQTNAIILKREDIFEADRLYYLYTEEFGKVRAVAGSVRKINAKLAGHLEPFSVVWLELIAKKNGDLFITTALSYGRLLKENSPPQIALFSKLADFAVKMLKEPQKDETLWNYLIKSFLDAREIKTGAGDEFLSSFKKGFLSLMGFGDNLEEAQYYLGDFDVL